MVGAALCAILGAGIDLRSHRIPNWLTYGGLLAALAIRAAFGRWGELKIGLEGMALGGGIFFLFFLVRGMGAGDVKLMAAVGAWVGVHRTLSVVLATAIAGGLLAIAYMIFSRRVLITLRNTGSLAWHHLTSGLKPHPRLNLQEHEALRMPYGLAIAMGTLYVLISSTHLMGVLYGH